MTNIRKQAYDRHAGADQYVIRRFSEKHGFTAAQAQEVVDRIGRSRKALDRAAEMLTG